MPGSQMPVVLRAYWRALRSDRHKLPRASSQSVTFPSASSCSTWVCHPPRSALSISGLIPRDFAQARSRSVRISSCGSGDRSAQEPGPADRSLCATRQAMLRQRHPLVLVGVRGWAHALLVEKVRSLGLADHVSFIGRVSDDELLNWYQRARLFVFPSLHEAFGLPVLEALACGTPVVAADILCLREVAADAVTYVDPTWAPSIARGIESALGDSAALARTASDGPEWAPRFAWDNVARATHMVYSCAAA